ncbi:polymorphic toxin-type HINT domain-containing protein [Kribbella sp. NPDC004536]|uniref:polymorphic toxin-type HINT domain-containing protein n=1 Tax=Kribbella sp. NPDC004536 TaxID=3364106 RepID=UPI0036A7EDDC
MRSLHTKRRPLAAMVTLLGVSLTAGMASYVPEAAAKTPNRPAPVTQKERTTPGKDFVPATVQKSDRVTGASALSAIPVWPQPSVSTVGAAPPSMAAKSVDSSPVAASVAIPSARSATPPSARLEVLSQAVGQRLGVTGVAMRISRTDAQAIPATVKVRFDYSKFAGAYGGDWSSRLRLVELTCTASQICSQERPIASTDNDVDSKIVTGEVEVSPAAPSSTAQYTTLALTAGASGPAGSYAATSLSPSAMWNVGAQTGDFTWSYPLRVPPGTTGPKPELSIGYSSGSVDGQIASTNNQTSWIGEGHSLEPGFIERKYVSCADDMSGSNTTVKTGDLCWKSDNAVLSLGSHSGELLKIGSDTVNKVDTFRLKNDDGSLIQRRYGATNGAQGGEYWQVTTSDGTKYFFGINPYSPDGGRANSVSTVPVFGNQAGEPCHTSTFATSYCTQAWRWNLDRVVDLSNNLMSYRYVQENNYYGRNNNTGVSLYQRASYPWIVDYGKVAGSAETTTAAPARVWFGVAERCLASGTVTCDPAQLTAANASHWPDTPFDQLCTSSTSCPNRTSPSFFTRKRLSTVNTEVLGSDNKYSPVDTWTMTQDYPATDVAPSLFLRSITHQGRVGGTLTNPTVTFTGVDKPNRVDAIGDGAPAMYKYRVSSVTSESGQTTSVNYSDADCTPTSKPANPATNTRRCFPVYWTIDGGAAPTMNWFNKYVVTSVVDDDQTTDAPDQQTMYEYVGTPAWHFDDNELTLLKYRSWGDWRGYSKVNVKAGPLGDQTQTQYLFFRGMHDDYLDLNGTSRKTAIVTDSQGDTIEDADRYNGFVREQITYDGAGGAEVEGTISTPWVTATGTVDGDTAMILRTRSSVTRTRLSSGSYRTAGTVTTFDAVGMPTSVDDLGDLATTADDRCIRYTYNRNDAIGLIAPVSREEKVSVACGTTPSRPAQVISDERSYFDGHTGLTDAPTRGLTTKVESMSGWSSGPLYEQRSRTVYDSLGRIVQSYDGLDRRTSTVTFTPATGGPVTAMTTTDSKGFVNTTSISPAWGATLAEVDPNGHRTDLTYDAFGRLTGVWLPNRSKSGGATASMIFSYLVSKTAPTVVATQELKPDGTYKTSRTLFDGLLRQRQVQTPAATGLGRVLIDTRYDARGNVMSQDGPYYDTSAPSNALFDANEPNLPARTLNTYDGADRMVLSQFVVQNAEKWRTETIYGGNAIAVIPPDGATTTIKMLDARGKVTELRQFHGRAAGGDYDSTKYTYTPDDQLETVTNAAGSTWRYGYDLRGRQVRTDDPDKGTTTSVYDAADRLVSSKDARGQELLYSYDELDRKTAVRSGSASGPVLTSWVYDTLGKGLLTSSTRTIGGNNYVSAVTGYDAMDRPVGTQVVIPASEGKLAGTYTSTTQYNPDGTVKKAKLPSTPGLPDETVDLYYDASGNLKQMGGWQAYVSDTVYGEYGDPLQYHMGQQTGKGIYQSFEYEQGTRRLSKMKVDRESVLETDDTFVYGYDDASNVTSISHQFGTSSDLQCFATDYLRRTSEAWTPAGTCADARSASSLGGAAPYWQSYRYDASGNRTSLIDHKVAGDTTSAYTYPAAAASRPHAVTGVTAAGPSGTSADSYAYDAAGNLASRTVGGDTDTFAWDSEGNLASVTGAGGDTGYVYDADGSRLIRHDSKGSTLYLASAEVRWDKTTDAVSSTRYYDFNGSTIAMRNNSGSVEYLMSDPHGTATVSVDGLTTTVSRRFMDPFGNARGTPSATWEPNSRGFVNGVDDPSTGLTHLGAREYDPKLGRFISVDPLVDSADPQTLNAYAYSNNSPATFSDPDGLMFLGSKAEEGTETRGHSDLAAEKQEAKKKTGSDFISYKDDDGKQINSWEEAEVSQHHQKVKETKKRIKKVIKDLVKIVADELGITDALNCFTDGDVGACISTGVTVLSSFVGGVAGKLITKYLIHAKKAWKLIGRIKDLVGEAIDGIKGLHKAEDELRAAGRCNSFTPEAQVLMADGRFKSIADIRTGDRVVATDPDTGKSSVSPVVGTIVGQGAKDLVTITTVTRSTSGAPVTSSTTATSGHPFYLPLLKRWIVAGQVEPGDRLYSGDPMKSVVVRRVDRRTAFAKVFNLTVARVHSYYLSAGGAPVLVHNCGEAWLDDQGEAYVRSKHTVSGERRDATKGYFNDEEDLYQLAEDSNRFPATPQENGRCARICDAGRLIGNRAPSEGGAPTSTYTVITDKYGGVVTMHPDVPR